MAAEFSCIRHVRPFLSQRQWSCLCVALRLPPIAAFSNECERLTSLDPNRPASSGNTPSHIGHGASQPITTFGKDGAYLLDKRHLHISLPWREPPANTLMDGTQAAQLLHRVFISGAYQRSLESIGINVRIPTAGVADVLQVINQLVLRYASSLTNLSITCEFVSQASQMAALAQQVPHFTGDPDDIASSAAACVPSSAPGHLQKRHCEYSQVPETMSTSTLSAIPSLSSPSPSSSSSAPLSPVIAAFDIRGCFLPELTYMNLSVPVIANELTRLSKLSHLSIRFLGLEEIQSWCRGCAEKEVVASCLHHHHIESYDAIIKQACCTLESIHVSGDLNSRRSGKIFSSYTFLPRLRALSLGWTCEEELRCLLSMLRSTTASLREILTASHQHSTLYQGFQLACQHLSWSDETALGASLSNPNNAVQLPPRVPALRRLSFSGPLRMGLSDLHLDLYTLVNQSSGRGVHFQYGLFRAHAQRVIRFRLDFQLHPFFALYRDLHSRLHHLYIKGIVGDDGTATPFGRRAFSSPPKRAAAEPATNDWTALLKYHHINPSTSTRHLYRTAQRMDFRQQRFTNTIVFPPMDEWKDENPPPLVGPEMTAFDLFRLEMWHLPVICQRDFSDTDQASHLWTTYLSQADREAWDVALTAYKLTRMQPGPLSFEEILPWWKRGSSCVSG